MFEKLMSSYFWPSILFAGVLGALSGIWLGLATAVCLVMALPTVTAVAWVVAHFHFIPASEVDIGLMTYRDPGDSEVSP